MVDQMLQTEFEFELPKGYVDDDGTLHREGTMRLATAADEIEPLQNPQVQSNSSYLTIVLLARTVTELGTLEAVDESVIQDLFVSDLEYLQAMYERINNAGVNAVDTVCPDCGTEFTVESETGAHVTGDPEDIGFDGVTGDDADAGPQSADADGGLQSADADPDDDVESTPRIVDDPDAFEDGAPGEEDTATEPESKEETETGNPAEW